MLIFLRSALVALSLIASCSVVTRSASAAEPAVLRATAEWVIGKKGMVEVGVGPRKRKSWVKDVAQIPQEPFSVSRVDLSRTDVTDAELERLAGLDELEGLYLSNCKVTGPGLAHLTKHEKLNDLSFYNGVVDDADLARLAPLKQLRILNLVHAKITDESLKVIAGFPELVDLNLDSTSVTDEGMRRLSTLTKLERLVVTGTKLTDAGLADIAKIKSLKQLTMHTTAVGDVGLQRIAELPKLEYAHLGNTFITAAGREALLAKLPQLKTEWDPARVRMPGAQPAAPVAGRERMRTPAASPAPAVSSATGSIPAGAMPTAVATSPERARAAAEWVLAKKGHLEVVFGPRKQRLGVKEVAQLPQEPFTLTRIDLSRTKTTDGELEQLVGLNDLEKLYFSDCSIAGPGLEHLAKLTTLQELSFYNGTVDDDDVRRLANLKRLRVLNLRRTPVTDEAMKIVAGFPELADLNLEATAITDAGLAHLASLPKLERLILAGTAVTDAGLVYIGKLASLKGVELQFCPITDAGVGQLASLTNLTWTSVRGSYVTAAGRDALQAKLPQVKIQWEEGIVKTGTPPKPIADVAGRGIKIKSKRLVQPLTIDGFFRAPLPKFLEGATVYAPSSGDLGPDPALGVIEVTIEKKMGVFLAADWIDKEEGEETEAWVRERTPYYQFSRKGWILVGGLDFADPDREYHSLFWKPCEAGETLRLRTQRSHPPIVIAAADPQLDPLPLVPNDAMSASIADDVAAAKVYHLLRQGKYAELEELVARIRQAHSRDRNGRPYLSIFYDGATPPAVKDEEFTADRAYLEAWLAAYPKSAAAHIAFAKYWRNYGWNARGTGFGYTITEEGAKHYQERTAKAREIVKRAYRLAEKDPYLCYLDVGLGIDHGDSKEEIEKIAAESLKIDPEYTSTLLEVAEYYLPRWHGEPGDSERWAERAAELTKDRWGEALYTLVVMSVTDYHGVHVFRDFKFSWPRTKQGFADLRKRFPDSENHADFAIRLGGLNGDRATVQAGFATLDRLRGGPSKPDSYIERTWRSWSRDDFAAGDQEQTIDVTFTPLLRVEWTVDGGRWIALDNREGLTTFDAETGKRLTHMEHDEGIAKLSAVVPFGKKLVAATWKGRILLQSIPDGEITVLGDHKDVSSAALSTDGSEYATVGDDRRIRFWNIDQPKDFPDEWALETQVTAVSYIPNSRTIAVGGGDGSVGFYHRDTMKKSVELSKRTGGIRMLTVSPDGNLLAVYDGKELTLWRIKEFELFATLPLPKQYINEIVFSRDGRYLGAATGLKPGDEHSVVVWKTKDGTLHKTLRGHKEMVRSISFSPDGSKLISGSDDNTLRVWKID